VSDFCSEFCPFLGCASCKFAGGEIPAAATVSTPVSGGASGMIRASAPSVSDPRDAANVRGRGPTEMESNVNDRTPQRIQRKRSKGWKMPEGAVYVGRPGKWGNPYAASGVTTAADAVQMYRDLIARVASGKRECSESDGLSVWDRHVIRHARDLLGGRDLACWCPLDQPCHADVLLEIANGGNA